MKQITKLEKEVKMLQVKIAELKKKEGTISKVIENCIRKHAKPSNLITSKAIRKLTGLNSQQVSDNISVIRKAGIPIRTINIQGIKGKGYYIK